MEERETPEHILDASTVEYIQMDNSIKPPPPEERVIRWLKRRSFLEKWLISALVFAVLLISALIPLSLNHYIRGEDQSQFCDSGACIQKAGQILSSLDQNVNPCINFYKFACGNYARDGPGSVDSPFIQNQNEVYLKIRQILNEEPSNDRVRPFDLVRTYYKTCLNTTRIEEDGLKTVRKLISEAGGWPVLDKNAKISEWTDLMIKMREMGMPYQHLFQLSVNPDNKNSSLLAIYLDQPVFETGVGDDTDPQFKQEYLDYKKSLAILFGADESTLKGDLDEVIKLENALKNITLSEADRGDPIKMYNPYTANDLWTRMPQIPWESLLNRLLPFNIYLKPQEKLIVQVPSYFFALQRILENTPKRTLVNFMIWRVVSSMAPFLGASARKIRTDFNRADSKERWKECIEIVSESNIGGALGSMYATKVSNETKSVEISVGKLYNHLKEAFKEGILATTWMDLTSKSAALDKLNAMKCSLDTLPQVMNLTKVEEYFKNLTSFSAENTTFLEMHLHLIKFGVDYTLGRLRNSVGEEFGWFVDAESALQANAFYQIESNKIVIPPALLQSPFMNRNLPYYLNFASMGWIISHELSHGFDNQGRRFDKNGNLWNWWQPATEEKYKFKAQCFIDQYENLILNTTGKADKGKETLNENIADNIGMWTAHRGYQKWVQSLGKYEEKKLVGFGNFTQNQVFWIGAANTFCGRMTPERLKILLENDIHSPKEIRVLGPFENMEEFAHDFDCPIGSPMNSGNRCSIW